ncbi:MAG: DNRLRE domain-containing protein [Bacteroidales bacterium]|nr:DNRLRE domain-containing protein [Bacteroidales bacterium]
MKRIMSSWIISILLISGSVFAQDFTFVVIPDPQNETEYNPAMLTSQMDWIINHRYPDNLVFVTCVGDLVNSGSWEEYLTADAAFDRLDNAGVPYSLGIGNHESSSLWSRFFGVSRFSSKSWFGGSYNDMNTYSLFSASGHDFILINLQFSPTTDIINWADNLLSTYSNRRAIVEQHDILNVDNSWLNRSSYDALRDHPNLFLMVCGHMNTSTDGAAYVAGTGTDGHTIHVVLANYQAISYGNGYLRLLRFSPANDRIYMTTYSPWTKSSLTTYPDRMELAYNMNNTSSSPEIITTGTFSTFRSEEVGTPSGEQSYTVAGTDLSDGIVITAPDDFEISTTPGSGFRSSVTLWPDNGTVASTRIYVRYNPSGTGTVRRNITNASDGAATRYVPVEGMVNYYTLSVETGSNGRIELSPPGGSYSAGTLVTLTASPNEGYAFDGWSGDLSGSDNPAVMTINSNLWVRAGFVGSPFTTVGLEATSDTRMSESQGTYNYGSSSTLSVSKDPDHRQGVLLKWDLADLDIHSDAIVVSASLTFYVTDPSACDLSLYRMRRSWVEGTEYGSPGTGASWEYYDAGSSRWGTEGAQNTDNDRYNTDLWDADAGVFSTSGSVTIPLNRNGLEVVQGWITNPSGNHGLTIQNYSGQSEGSTDPWIVRSNESSSYFGPRLNISWCVVTAGAIGHSHNICFNSVPPALTSTEDGTGSSTLYYRWESNRNLDEPSWSVIPGQTGEAYAPEALTETTQYRRTTVSVINNVAYESSPTEPVQITVQTPVDAGVIGSDQTICYNTIPSVLTSITEGAGSGAISYRWEWNANIDAPDWSVIPGETGASYTSGPLTETTQYRRIAVSTVDHMTCESSPAEAVQIKVQVLPTAGMIGSDQTICHNSIPAALTNITNGTGSGAITYRWESNSDKDAPEWSEIAGQTGIAYTPGPLQETTHYRRITISTADGVSCESSPSDTVSITMLSNGSWAGSVSGDWEVPENWCGGVPGNNADIYIPPGTTVHVTSPASSPIICRDLTVAGTLVIDAGAALTVYGELSLTEDGNLYINYEKSMTAPDINDEIASLITNSPVEANIQICLDVDTLNACLWDFFSPPVSELDVAIFTDNECEPAQFIESLVTDVDSTGDPFIERGWVSWDNLRYFNESGPDTLDNTFNSLIAGKGYNLRYTRPATYNFTGILNTSISKLDLACTGESVHWSGYNLIGNPFTSGINVEEMFRDPEWPSSVHKTVWLMRNGKWRVWSNGIGVPDDANQGHIPPMQAFFVKATAGGSVSLPWIKEHHKNHEYKDEDPLIPMVRLSVSANGKAGETVIRFDEKNKPDCDKDYDAPRVFSDPDEPSIYTSLNGIDYTINGLPKPYEFVDIPVNIEMITESRHTITAMQIQGLNGYKVLLRDKLTGTLTDLKSVNEYSFSAPSGSVKDRFLLSIINISTGIEEQPLAEGLFNIYPGSGFINILPVTDKWSGKKGSVKVMDLSGRPVRELHNAEFIRNNLIRLPSPKAGGIYFVEMRSGNFRFVGKVVVR